jgi:hypothetical protein
MRKLILALVLATGVIAVGGVALRLSYSPQAEADPGCSAC